ncbi:MAG TPA: phosphoglycerate mutase family protein [Bacteroidia bacterium]|jgi:phosphohistidine phosphatase
MKTLYIVRHAKSDKDNTTLEDIDRPLNARGYPDAHAMALKLKAAGETPELMISSPAIRALTTALIFARKFNYDTKKIILEDSLYETGMEEYMNVIHNTPDSYSTVMIFGHNSTISSLVNTLTKPFTDNVPTCGIIAISFPGSSWKDVAKGAGKLALYDFPKNLQR